MLFIFHMEKELFPPNEIYNNQLLIIQFISNIDYKSITTAVNKTFFIKIQIVFEVSMYCDVKIV